MEPKVKTLDWESLKQQLCLVVGFRSEQYKVEQQVLYRQLYLYTLYYTYQRKGTFSALVSTPSFTLYFFKENYSFIIFSSSLLW